MPFKTLPVELTINIISYEDDILQLHRQRRVSKTWNRIISDVLQIRSYVSFDNRKHPKKAYKFLEGRSRSNLQVYDKKSKDASKVEVHHLLIEGEYVYEPTFRSGHQLILRRAQGFLSNKSAKRKLTDHILRYPAIHPFISNLTIRMEIDSPPNLSLESVQPVVIEHQERELCPIHLLDVYNQLDKWLSSSMLYNEKITSSTWKADFTEVSQNDISVTFRQISCIYAGTINY